MSLNRRTFLKLSSLAAAGGVLAACAPKATPAPAENPTEKPAEVTATEQPTAEAPAAESVNVQYWVQWPELYTKSWDLMRETPEFKEALGNNTIEVKPGVTEEALLTAVAGGTPPDGAANYNYLDYMSREVVIPIDDFVSASTKIKKADYLEAVWDIGNYKGKQYGLPANECFVQQGFVYNAKMVRNAGLDPEKPPVTWDDLYIWHQTITKFDAAGNVTAIGYDPTDFMGQTIWGSSAWDVSTSWGFDWFDQDAGKFNFNNADMVDYFNTAKKFVDLIGVDQLAAAKQVSGQGEWGPSYYSGVLASMLDGYWEPGELASTKPEMGADNRASWIPVPESKRGTLAQGAGGHIVIIFKDAKNQELMFKAAEFLSTKAACDIIFKNVGWLPAVKTYLDQVDGSTYAGLQFFLDSAKQATYWGLTEKCPITNFVGTVYPQIREQVFRKELTAEAAAAELQKRAEDEWVNAGFAG
jgi:multiple sugar transport system substrate-binding protein